LNKELFPLFGFPTNAIFMGLGKSLFNLICAKVIRLNSSGLRIKETYAT
jgi:hypothetical protein